MSDQLSPKASLNGQLLRARANIFTNSAAAGGVYEFSRRAAANLREKNDHYNETIGGFLGGATMALRGMFSSLLLSTRLALILTNLQLGVYLKSSAEACSQWLRSLSTTTLAATYGELRSGPAARRSMSLTEKSGCGRTEGGQSRRRLQNWERAEVCDGPSLHIQARRGN